MSAEYRFITASLVQLTCLPGHPIHVKLIFFFVPDNAETRPPLDMEKVYSPFLSLTMVTGRRLLTTMSRCSFAGGGAGVEGGGVPLDCSGTSGSLSFAFLGETGLVE